MRTGQNKDFLNELDKFYRHFYWDSLRISYAYFSASLQAFDVAGKNSPVICDLKQAFLTFKKVYEETCFLIEIMFSKSNQANDEKNHLLLLGLEDVSHKTIIYYHNLFHLAKTVCQAHEDKKQHGYSTQYIQHSIYPPKDFLMVTETNAYFDQLLFLTLTSEDVREFLDYPIPFWQFIQERTYYMVDSFDNEGFYGVNILEDDNHAVIDFRIMVPYVMDLKTALINIHEFKHAFDLYMLLNSPLPLEDKVFEENAKLVEKDFLQYYIPKMRKKKKNTWKSC